MLYDILLSRALAALMTIYAILVQGVMGSMHVKSSLICSSGSGKAKIRTTDETDHNSSHRATSSHLMSLSQSFMR